MFNEHCSMFNEHCSSRPGGITLAVKRCWITLDFFTSFNALILYPWFYDYDMAPPSSPLLISFFFGVNSSVARIMLFDMPIPRCRSSPNLTHENFFRRQRDIEIWNKGATKAMFVAAFLFTLFRTASVFL